MLNRIRRSSFFPVLLFSFFGFLAMGYHPGSEDDGVYLASTEANLNPALFPHDLAFIQLQMRTSVFDTWMARFVHFSGIPLAWAELFWQAFSLFLIVWAGWMIVGQLFPERTARWGAAAMLSAMFTLPVAGTALYIADQYLHPRNPACALILFAVSRILAGRRWQAIPFLCVAFVLHPLMAALGVSFCFMLTLTNFEPLREQIRSWRARPVSEAATAATPFAAIIPFGWVFNPPSQIWVDALTSRHWSRIYNWTWYEWLGAIAPIALFWLVAVVARRQGQERLSRFAFAVVFYGIFQQSVAMIISGPRALIGLSTFEPMRFLQLIYVFMTLVGGAYLGKYFLKARVFRWAAFLIVANGGMFLAQRQLFAGTEHFELPGRSSSNPWLQAFAWVKQNTPQDAYFALDPNYMSADYEDYHSFRAVAERSVLADAVKDRSVITKVPELGPRWQKQIQAEAGWNHFQKADFERLKSEFNVSWVIVRNPMANGLDCRWHNDLLAVCRIP